MTELVVVGFNNPEEADRVLAELARRPRLTPASLHPLDPALPCGLRIVRVPADRDHGFQTIVITHSRAS